MSELKNIWIITKSGFLINEKRNIKETVFLGMKLYGLLLLLKAVSFGLLFLLDYYGVFKIPQHITGENLESYKPLHKIVILVVIAPILEELTYRSGLIFSKQNLIISTIGISYSVLDLSGLDRLFCILIAFGIGLILFFSFNQKHIKLFSKLWKINRRKIFYGLLFCFGLSHLGNYELRECYLNSVCIFVDIGLVGMLTTR